MLLKLICVINNLSGLNFAITVMPSYRIFVIDKIRNIEEVKLVDK